MWFVPIKTADQQSCAPDDARVFNMARLWLVFNKHEIDTIGSMEVLQFKGIA